MGNEQAAANLRAALEQTFAEDLQIEVAMQQAQEETGLRQIVVLEIDRAPSLAVRMIESEGARQPHEKTAPG